MGAMLRVLIVLLQKGWAMRVEIIIALIHLFQCHGQVPHARFRARWTVGLVFVLEEEQEPDTL